MKSFYQYLKPNTIISAICFLLVILFIFYLSSLTLLFADDFMYGTFLRGGFSGFISENIWHYSNFNGRVIVHILAQLTLYFDMILFPFVNVAMLILFAVFSLKLQGIKPSLFSIAFVLSSIMLLDISILRESLLWISASFNYIYPSMVLVILLHFVFKTELENRVRWYGIVIAFLAGASTEQVGATTIFTIILAILFRKITIKKSLFYLISALAGLITIFCSQATFARFSRENASVVEGSSAQVILARLLSVAEIMFETRVALIAVAFLLLIAIVTRFNFKKILHHPQTVILIFAAVFSVLVMIFTNSITPRVFFPAALLMIAACAYLVTKINFRSNVYSIVGAIYVAICLIFLIPTINNYKTNHSTMQSNIANINFAIESGSNIYYNLDFIETHRHSMAHDDGFFYIHFRNFYQIPVNSRIYFYSNYLPAIFTTQGSRLSMPAIYNENGWMLPIAIAVEALGGSISWSFAQTDFHIYGREIILNNRTNIIHFDENSNLVELDLSERNIRNLNLFLYADDIRRIFGIEYIIENGYIVIYLK